MEQFGIDAQRTDYEFCFRDTVEPRRDVGTILGCRVAFFWKEAD